MELSASQESRQNGLGVTPASQSYREAGGAKDSGCRNPIITAEAGTPLGRKSEIICVQYTLSVRRGAANGEHVSHSLQMAVFYVDDRDVRPM